MPRKPKSIWTKDLLHETKIGRRLTPVLLFIIAGFLLYQGFRGLVYEEAIAISKYGASYTYRGNSAQFLGLAYLCALIFFASFLLYDFAIRNGLRRHFTAFVVVVGLVFIVSLVLAIVRESLNI